MENRIPCAPPDPVSLRPLTVEIGATETDETSA